MMQSRENTQTQKDESGRLPHVVFRKEGREIEEPDQQAAARGEKGFASTRKPTNKRGGVGLTCETDSLLRHTGRTSIGVSTDRSFSDETPSRRTTIRIFSASM
jgi:hypothetical protein